MSADPTTAQEPLFPGIESIPKPVEEPEPALPGRKDTAALEQRVAELSSTADELRWSLRSRERGSEAVWVDILVVRRAITERARSYPAGSEGRESARGALFDFLCLLGDRHFHNRHHRGEAEAWAYVDRLIDEAARPADTRSDYQNEPEGA